MTVFNDERHVALAIESILHQRFRDFEFIIVDDGSTDGTPAVLADYARRDHRIIVHCQANAGTTVAANNGLKLARGEFVARLDSDDVSFPHRLQEEVAFLRSRPDVALVGGGAEIIDVDGRVIGTRHIMPRDPRRTLRHRCIYQQSDVMFRRTIVLELGGYREKFRNAQDYDLWLRISEAAGVAKLDRLLGQWRLNGGGYTLSRIAEQKREVVVVKRFASRRRHGLPDGYEAYQPPPPPPHRSPIGPRDYRLIVAAVLLKDLRFREARTTAGELWREQRALRPFVIWLLSFAPRPAIAYLGSIREWYLNHLA